jgi:serine phosphatase RsbU (regulator of sigma subunit)/PAS domain-containing protein
MSSEVDPIATELFEGPGEMRSLARTFDWAATPLGPVDEWSPTLRVVVQMILSSGLPQIVLWGRELTQVYNDAYAALIQAKHPAALGRGNLEVWPEVAHLNGPIYERVFEGETVTLEDARYPLQRSGVAEDVYLTVSFSPIREPEGRVVGVLAAMVETTQTVAIRALQEEREQLYRDLEVERARLRMVVRQAPAFIATLRGPDHVFEMANPPYLQLVGHREILGRPVREALPEVEGQGFLALLDQVYATGESYVGNEVPILLQREPGAEMEEHYVNFVYQPLRGGTGAVEGILAHGVDVTDLVLARREAEETHREQTAMAETLQRVGRSVAAELDTERLVQAVTDAATSLTGAQFGAFFYNVLNERGESYMLYAISGVPREAFSHFPMPRNTPIFGPTFYGEGVVRSDDITKDPRYGRMAPYHGMPPGHLPVRSYLAVPVVSRTGEVLGGLFFGHERTGVFDEDAERLVVAVSALAAVAIENVRLHDAARRELEASRRAYLERDHVARVLQESLLPPRLPAVEGLDLAARYTPGEGVVGGDFYDLFEIGGDAFGATIGDVQGKDARAAGMTNVVRHSLRSAAQTHDPAAALAIVNRIVLQEQEPSDPRFSSAALARLERDGDGFRVRLCSAGHPPALVVRATGAVEECHAPGTLLGITEEPELGVAETRLGPGDTLVLYTDGLIEARSAGIGILGEERVRDLLAAEAGATAESLASRLEELAAGYSEVRRRDDLALLVARVNPR